MQSNTRPPSVGGMRPPSNAGFAAPGSRAGFGVGTRGASSYGNQVMAGQGSALNTNVEVAIRPVTNQGMKGVHPTSAGPRRQVADRSYYLGLLRSKNAELQAELERLRQQEESLTKSNISMLSMDKKTKGLQTDVNALKEKLTDYNFAVSKAQSGVDVDTMVADTEMLKDHNQQQSAQVDNLFLDVKARESKAKELEAQIKSQLDELDQKLNAEPEKRAQYYQLREQSARLQEEVLPMQREIDTLQRKYQTLSAELKADTQRQTAIKLQDKKGKLEKQKADLLEEIRNSPNGQLPDEKSKLLSQVKSDTNEIEVLQQQTEDTKDIISRLTKNIQQMDADLQEYKGERAEKYKELEAKDREMQEFIDNFAELKGEVSAETAKAEESIINKLEALGKNLHFVETLQKTSQAQVQEMQGDLDFKKKQLDYSLSTHERLKNELDLRKKELEKVNNLDAKITTELEAITEKIKSNEEAIRKFSDLEALRQDADKKKRELHAAKARALKLRDYLKATVHHLTSTKYEPLRQSLNENEAHASLQAQEQKIRLIQQTGFTLSDFIAQKGAEADYLPLKADCLSMCEEINKYIIQQVTPK